MYKFLIIYTLSHLVPLDCVAYHNYVKKENPCVDLTHENINDKRCKNKRIKIMNSFYPRKKSTFKNNYIPRSFDVLGFFVIELH